MKFIVQWLSIVIIRQRIDYKRIVVYFHPPYKAYPYDLDPYQYYVEIMKAIPHCETAEDYEALLPWNIDLVTVTTKDQ